VHHLFDQQAFAEKFRKLVEGRFKRYGHFEYDTEGEIERYKVCSIFVSCADDAIFPPSLSHSGHILMSHTTRNWQKGSSRM
jgi:hypothetical protein